ncbi:MAG TPA: sigma-54 factor interaction domain-containing protein, partial [Anaerovoracaceae bacterium]|nr:sigma-54 factor interaction domain-containing protein [Anaerovoracaceae bacterium]
MKIEEIMNSEIIDKGKIEYGINGKDVEVMPDHKHMFNILKNHEFVSIEPVYIEKTKKYISGRIEPIFLHGSFLGAAYIFRDDTLYKELIAKMERANQVVLDLQQQVRNQEIIDKHKIIGKSVIFTNMLTRATIVAGTDVPVLITGESGAGKEMIAKYLHDRSSRAGKPFITVNCAAIPETLIESELFGYTEGAFTGAKEKGKMGKFEMADGGTLLLDEIGDMPLMMQTKLLRAIQEKEIEKIGSEKKVAVDVRIITATNQSLEELIEEKKFRMDLFYRINTAEGRFTENWRNTEFWNKQNERILNSRVHFVLTIPPGAVPDAKCAKFQLMCICS